MHTLQLVYQVNDWPTVSWGCGLGPFGEVELTYHATLLGLNITVCVAVTTLYLAMHVCSCDNPLPIAMCVAVTTLYHMMMTTLYHNYDDDYPLPHNQPFTLSTGDILKRLVM